MSKKPENIGKTEELLVTGTDQYIQNLKIATERFEESKQNVKELKRELVSKEKIYQKDDLDIENYKLNFQDQQKSLEKKLDKVIKKEPSKEEAELIKKAKQNLQDDGLELDKKIDQHELAQKEIETLKQKLSTQEKNLKQYRSELEELERKGSPVDKKSEPVKQKQEFTPLEVTRNQQSSQIQQIKIPDQPEPNSLEVAFAPKQLESFATEKNLTPQSPQIILSDQLSTPKAEPLMSKDEKIKQTTTNDDKELNELLEAAEKSGKELQDLVDKPLKQPQTFTITKETPPEPQQVPTPTDVLKTPVQNATISGKQTFTITKETPPEPQQVPTPTDVLKAPTQNATISGGTETENILKELELNFKAQNSQTNIKQELSEQAKQNQELDKLIEEAEKNLKTPLPSKKSTVSLDEFKELDEMLKKGDTDREVNEFLSTSKNEEKSVKTQEQKSPYTKINVSIGMKPKLKEAYNSGKELNSTEKNAIVKALTKEKSKDQQANRLYSLIVEGREDIVQAFEKQMNKGYSNTNKNKFKKNDLLKIRTAAENFIKTREQKEPTLEGSQTKTKQTLKKPKTVSTKHKTNLERQKERAEKRKIEQEKRENAKIEKKKEREVKKQIQKTERDKRIKIEKEKIAKNINKLKTGFQEAIVNSNQIVNKGIENLQKEIDTNLKEIQPLQKEVPINQPQSEKIKAQNREEQAEVIEQKEVVPQSIQQEQKTVQVDPIIQQKEPEIGKTIQESTIQQLNPEEIKQESLTKPERSSEQLSNPISNVSSERVQPSRQSKKDDIERVINEQLGRKEEPKQQVASEGITTEKTEEKPLAKNTEQKKEFQIIEEKDIKVENVSTITPQNVLDANIIPNRKEFDELNKIREELEYTAKQPPQQINANLEDLVSKAPYISGLDKDQRNNAIRLFNDNPRKGIELIDKYCLENKLDPVKETADLFLKEKNNLDLEAVGDYLGTDGTRNKEVLQQFIKNQDFKGKSHTDSLRNYLEAFKLPGEAQKVDRLVESFGEKYCEQNPDSNITNKDSAYVLAFATIQVHTDLHSGKIPPEKQMTLEQFKKNLKGTNEGKDFDEKLLTDLYNDIKTTPLKYNFTKVEPGYKLDNTGLKNDQTFKNFDKLLSGSKIDVGTILPKLSDQGIKATPVTAKSTLKKFTGYEGSVTIENKEGHKAIINVSKPSKFSEWFLGKKPKVTVLPVCEEGKQPTQESINMAAQIANSFSVNIKSIKATYDYQKEDLDNAYKLAKSGIPEPEKKIEQPNIENQKTTTEVQNQKESPYNKVDIDKTINQLNKLTGENLVTKDPKALAQSLLQNKSKDEQADILYSAVVDGKGDRVFNALVKEMSDNQGFSRNEISEVLEYGKDNASVGFAKQLAAVRFADFENSIDLKDEIAAEKRREEGKDKEPEQQEFESDKDNKEKLSGDSLAFDNDEKKVGTPTKTNTERDSITDAIRSEILEKQQIILQDAIAETIKDPVEKEKFQQLSAQEFREYLKTAEGKKAAAEQHQKPEIKAKLNEVSSAGYKKVHEDFKDSFRDVSWEGNKDTPNIKSSQIKNEKGELVADIKETTHNIKPISLTLEDGTSKTVSSYRTIEFPSRLKEPNGPLHLSMALKDENGKNMPENGALYFTAHYDESGKLTEVSSPTPVKFMGKGDDAVGYIEKDGKVFTLPVTQGKYKEMMREVEVEGHSVNLSQEVETKSVDKVMTKEVEKKEKEKPKEPETPNKGVMEKTVAEKGEQFRKIKDGDLKKAEVKDLLSDAIQKGDKEKVALIVEATKSGKGHHEGLTKDDFEEVYFEGMDTAGRGTTTKDSQNKMHEAIKVLLPEAGMTLENHEMLVKGNVQSLDNFLTLRKKMDVKTPEGKGVEENAPTKGVMEKTVAEKGEEITKNLTGEKKDQKPEVKSLQDFVASDNKKDNLVQMDKILAGKTQDEVKKMLVDEIKRGHKETVEGIVEATKPSRTDRPQGTQGTPGLTKEDFKEAYNRGMDAGGKAPNVQVQRHIHSAGFKLTAEGGIPPMTHELKVTVNTKALNRNQDQGMSRK